MSQGGSNPRIDASPAPVVVHVLAAAVFALVGAGLLVAGSALWMTLFYPGAPGGDVLWAARLLFGSSMAASIVLGFTAIRRRDIAAHRAVAEWVIRRPTAGRRRRVRASVAMAGTR